jgi:hypothetical protein
MHFRILHCVVVSALCVLAIDTRPARCDEAKKKAVPSPEQARKAIATGLAFLEKDAAKWRKERGCATCHHGTMTVWALSEAKARGYAVNAENLADIVQWTKGRLVPRLDRPRDTRPGRSMVSTPALYLGVMSQELPVLSRSEVTRLAGHIERHQEADGSISWASAPALNRPPPFFESDEVATLLALLAWEPRLPADPKETATARTVRDRAVQWLSKTKPTDTTQAATFRLLLEAQDGAPAERLRSGIDQLLSRQQSDGGWGQLNDAPSDAYATGQVLYALSRAGIEKDRAEVQRAISFLVANQREDGSWPMTRRSHPDAKKPGPFVVPITYFGSAWATIGLVRFVPLPPDTAANQEWAFDSVRGFHGKYDVDESSPNRPVVRVDLRSYEVSDEEVEHFTKVLQAFPQLATLQFKSTKITDAGLAHLKSLPRLRSLTLENAAITDGGLMHLKVLTQLQEVDLKGTKVSDAGVQELQKALPSVKVER